MRNLIWSDSSTFITRVVERRRGSSAADVAVDRRRENGPRVSAMPASRRNRDVVEQQRSRCNLSLFEFQIGLFIGFG